MLPHLLVHILEYLGFLHVFRSSKGTYRELILDVLEIVPREGPLDNGVNALCGHFLFKSCLGRSFLFEFFLFLLLSSCFLGLRKSADHPLYCVD